MAQSADEKEFDHMVELYPDVWNKSEKPAYVAWKQSNRRLSRARIEMARLDEAEYQQELKHLDARKIRDQIIIARPFGRGTITARISESGEVWFYRNEGGVTSSKWAYKRIHDVFSGKSKTCYGQDAHFWAMAMAMLPRRFQPTLSDDEITTINELNHTRSQEVKKAKKAAPKFQAVI